MNRAQRRALKGQSAKDAEIAEAARLWMVRGLWDKLVEDFPDSASAIDARIERDPLMSKQRSLGDLEIPCPVCNGEGAEVKKMEGIMETTTRCGACRGRLRLGVPPIR